MAAPTFFDRWRGPWAQAEPPNLGQAVDQPVGGRTRYHGLSIVDSACIIIRERVCDHVGPHGRPRSAQFVMDTTVDLNEQRLEEMAFEDEKNLFELTCGCGDIQRRSPRWLAANKRPFCQYCNRDLTRERDEATKKVVTTRLALALSTPLCS
jgi:hypothetical protein